MPLLLSVTRLRIFFNSPDFWRTTKGLLSVRCITCLYERCFASILLVRVWLFWDACTQDMFTKRKPYAKYRVIVQKEKSAAMQIKVFIFKNLSLLWLFYLDFFWWVMCLTSRYTCLSIGISIRLNTSISVILKNKEKSCLNARTRKINQNWQFLFTAIYTLVL